MTIEESKEAKEQHDQVDKPWTRHKETMMGNGANKE
jgi:hypothetical protein